MALRISFVSIVFISTTIPCVKVGYFYWCSNKMSEILKENRAILANLVLSVVPGTGIHEPLSFVCCHEYFIHGLYRFYDIRIFHESIFRVLLSKFTPILNNVLWSSDIRFGKWPVSDCVKRCRCCSVRLHLFAYVSCRTGCNPHVSAVRPDRRECLSQTNNRRISSLQRCSIGWTDYISQWNFPRFLIYRFCRVARR